MVYQQNLSAQCSLTAGVCEGFRLTQCTHKLRSLCCVVCIRRVQNRQRQHNKCVSFADCLKVWNGMGWDGYVGLRCKTSNTTEYTIKINRRLKSRCTYLHTTTRWIPLAMETTTWHDDVDKRTSDNDDDAPCGCVYFFIGFV